MKCTGLTPVKLRILTGRFLPFFCRLSQEFRPAGNGRSGPVEKLRPAGPVRSEKIGPVPTLPHILQSDNGCEFVNELINSLTLDFPGYIEFVILITIFYS
jgi:hypothetical protein